MFKAISDSLLSVIYPQQCRSCRGSVERSELGVACIECWEKTRIFNGSECLCAKCGAFLGPSAKPIEAMCRKCDDHKYDAAVAIGIYEQALSASVINLKSSPHISKRLKNLLAAAFENSHFQSTTLIVPVPLSTKRFLERGFNQASMIAQAVSDASGIKIDAHSLIRKIHTPVHRAGMDIRARELTVQNAFEVTRPKLISGQKILLVDDVLTSGATVSYCAKALKKSGAAEVNVLTLARAV